MADLPIVPLAATHVINGTTPPEPLKIADNVLAGLPEDFTLEQLSEFLSEDEIARLQQGDDPLLPGDLPEVQIEAPAVYIPVVEAPAQAAAATAMEVFTTQTVMPIPQMPNTSGAAQQIQTLEAQRQAVVEKYNDGDLSLAEYDAQNTALIRQQMQLQVQADAALQNYTTQRQMREAAWVPLVTAYQAANPSLATQDHYAGWDAALKSVTVNPELSKMPLEHLIQIAHKQYADTYQMRTGQALPAGAALPQVTLQPAPAQVPAPVPGPRTDPRPAPIQTLATVPVTQASSPSGSRFDHIEQLQDSGDVLGAEALIKQLSSADREAYLMGM